MAPLAPVVATVRFLGGVLGNEPPAGSEFAPSNNGAYGLEKGKSRERELGYGIHSQSSIAAQRGAADRAGGS